MRIDIVTIFPDAFSEAFSQGTIRIARENGAVDIKMIDLRDFTTDRHRTVDDKPYGGFPGMVMKPEPVFEAVKQLRSSNTRVVLLTPQGHLFDQDTANRLAEYEHIVLVCGRYKGVDERVTQVVDEELSIGDYVLSGGEFAAMVVVDAVTRLIPGVIGDFESAKGDSFHSQILDAPYYTRPREYEELRVPDTLISGDHEEIRRWQKREALRRTLQRRPDLLDKAELDEEAESILKELRCQKEKKEKSKLSIPETP
jgi:tRNA (guanine37-N1)-methyltransferase